MADLTRRSFLTHAGALLALTAASPALLLRKQSPDQPQKFNQWDIAEDGSMSLHGQTEFAVYTENGDLSRAVCRYRWKDGSIIETQQTNFHAHDARTVEMDLGRGSGSEWSERVIWAEASGGVLG